MLALDCDDCETTMYMRYTNTNGELEATYYMCPKCGKVYPVSLTDAALREEIKKTRALNEEIRRRGPKEAGKELIRKALSMKDANIKRCRQLMEEHRDLFVIDTVIE